MAGLKGKSGPPGNMNAFKHGLASIQKRREEGVPTEQEENVRQQILEGLIAERNNHPFFFESRHAGRTAPCPTMTVAPAAVPIPASINPSELGGWTTIRDVRIFQLLLPSHICLVR